VHRLIASLGVLAALTFATTPAEAQALERPLRAALAMPADAELARRIEGQTADLDWQLVAVAETTAENAEALARTRGARVLLRVERDEGDGALVLSVHDLQEQQLLTRRFELQPPGDAATQSAQREALALALRSSLRALAAGDAIGAETETLAPPDPGTAEPAAGASGLDAPQTTPKAPRPDPGTDAGTRRTEASQLADGASWGLRLEAGLWSSLDGQSRPAQLGPWLALGLRLPTAGLELDLRGQLGLGAGAGDDAVELELQRHHLLVGLGLSLPLGRRWQLRPGLAAGVAQLRRHTAATAPQLQGTEDSRHLTPALELSLALRLRVLTGSFGQLGLAAVPGLLWLPESTRLRYELDGEVAEQPLWRLSPSLVVAVALQR